MRSVSVRLADLDRVKINLGIAGENEHTHVLFDCKKAFDQYPNATPFLIVTPPRGDIYPAVVTRDGDIVEWVVTDSDLIYHGNGKVQLQFKQGDIIMKSYEARTSIAISSEPTGTVPTPIQNWITQANAILASIPDDINAALAAAKASGEFDGADGVGIAAITLKSTVGLVDTYTITLTDGRGYDFTVTNGTPGQNGVGIQSIAKTSTVGLVDTYTVTLTNGQTYPFTVTNGQNGVEIDDTTPASDKVFSSAKVDEELTDVKTAIHGVEDILTVGEADVVTNWNQGLINGATGEIVSSDTRIYSPDYFEYKAGLKLQMSYGLQYALRYYDSNKSFMEADAVWHSESGEIVPAAHSTFKYFRINISRINGENISPSDSFNVSLGETFHFDKTLSQEGKGADAKATGNAIKESAGIRNEATIYYEKGAISTADGTDASNSSRIRSKNIDVNNIDYILVKESNAKYSLRVYSASHSYLGYDRESMNNDPISREEIKALFPTAKYIRIVAGTTNDSSTFNIDDLASNISVIGDFPNYKAILNANILKQGINDNVTNSPVLCAVKYFHRENKHDVPIGWLYRDIVEPFDFYYSADGKTMTKIFTWDKTATDNGNRSPLEYSIAITYEGDVICVYRGEYAYTKSITPIRQNPIVYPHDDYENPVQINFGSNVPPTSWLMNCGCYSEDGTFFMCEYTRYGHDYAYVWRVSAPYTSTSDWEIVKTFQVSGQQKGFKHCHMVDRDPFTGVLWLSTGDIPPNAGSTLVGTPGIYYSTDDGDTWSVLLEGSEKYCRQLKFIWCDDYVYWASDASDRTVHYFIRAKRNNNGIIDTNTIEELFHFDDTDAASYNLCYSEDPKGIMVLNRYDDETAKDIEIYFWDIQRNKMYVIGVVKSTGNFLTGFRTEAMNHYPAPNGIGYLAGFGLCPNNLKMDGNKVNTHVSQYYGYTDNDEYNVGSINNIVVKIAKR